MKIIDVLKVENIEIIDEQLNWEDAIRRACKKLIEGGYVTSEYPEGIIKNTYELGAYYVLVEDLAFLHARPEQGAIENQLSIMVSKQKVSFSEETRHDARLLITLSAKDSEEHIEVMRVLAELFNDKDKINEIINADSAEEIYSIFIGEEA